MSNATALRRLRHDAEVAIYLDYANLNEAVVFDESEMSECSALLVFPKGSAHLRSEVGAAPPTEPSNSLRGSVRIAEADFDEVLHSSSNQFEVSDSLISRTAILFFDIPEGSRGWRSRMNNAAAVVSCMVTSHAADCQSQ